MARSTINPIATTNNMTNISVNFILFRYLNVLQKKVSYAIKNIRPAKLAKGIISMIGDAASNTINIVREAHRVESLLTPPDSTLILLYPSRAPPPNEFVHPQTKLDIP